MNEIMRYDLDRDTDEGCADMIPISDGRYVEFEDLERIITEHASQPKPDSVLCKFYDVTDWSGLVRELVDHVAQLQESAKRNVKPWEDTFPPTLLPAYIERVNAANAAAQPQDVPVACAHEWTDDGGHLLVCTACGAQEDHEPGWQDMAAAPTDGTMVRLLVEFEEHSTEDAEQAPTIGANNFDNDGEDVWRFAGWCWSHDHFTEGKGTPVGWLPMLDGPKLSPVAEQPAPVAVAMSFDFEHPSSKERRTVALSKQDVFDGMEDYFYDKLGEQICRCESVGETNVVDCSCDEYVHDFEIVKASLTS